MKRPTESGDYFVQIPGCKRGVVHIDMEPTLVNGKKGDPSICISIIGEYTHFTIVGVSLLYFRASPMKGWRWLGRAVLESAAKP